MFTITILCCRVFFSHAEQHIKDGWTLWTLYYGPNVSWARLKPPANSVAGQWKQVFSCEWESAILLFNFCKDTIWRYGILFCFKSWVGACTLLSQSTQGALPRKGHVPFWWGFYLFLFGEQSERQTWAYRHVGAAYESKLNQSLRSPRDLSTWLPSEWGGSHVSNPISACNIPRSNISSRGCFIEGSLRE